MRRHGFGGSICKSGRGYGFGQIGPRLIGQGHKALDHQRVAPFVELAHIVKQAVAELAAPAGTFGNTRKNGTRADFSELGNKIA